MKMEPGGGSGASRSVGTGEALDHAARWVAGVVGVLSLVVLVSWFLGPDTVARLDPGRATMKANTALACLVLAAALVVRRTPLVLLLTAAVAAAATVSLVEYLLDADLGISELLVEDTISVGVNAEGRMGPPTAASLLVLAAARWAVHRGALRTAQALLAVPLAVSGLALLGYLFKVEQFYTVVAYSSLALSTAVALALLTAGTACLVAGGIAPRLMSDTGPGATLARHMAPVAVLVVPLLGFLVVVGEDRDVFGARFAIALLVAAAAAVLLTVAAVATTRLDRIDRERLAAQAALREANDQLRERRDLEWRRAEQLSRSLGEERARFQRAISKVDDLIWTVEVTPDGELRPDFTTGDATGLFGGSSPAGHENERAIFDMVHPEDVALLEQFDDKIRAGVAAEVELRILGYDGEVRWAWVRGTPRRERNQLFFDGISTNVTDRHHLAERRENLLRLEQEQVRKLKQLNQLREELLAVTGHELRTPLAVVLGYAELLLQHTDVDAVQRQHLEVVARRARQMALLVDDIFDLAKFSAGLATIEVEQVALHDTVAATVEDHSASAKDAGVTIDVDVDPITVAADPARLRQILDNLLSNAIKYSLPGGDIAVTATCDGDTATIAVSDGGIGIPEREIEHVFDRMYRASTAKDREIEGTGLGLSVAKVLVEAHDGTIAVSARPEGGTTFTVAIPVQRPASSTTSDRFGTSEGSSDG